MPSEARVCSLEEYLLGFQFNSVFNSDISSSVLQCFFSPWLSHKIDGLVSLLFSQYDHREESARSSTSCDIGHTSTSTSNPNCPLKCCYFLLDRTMIGHGMTLKERITPTVLQHWWNLEEIYDLINSKYTLRQTFLAFCDLGLVSFVFFFKNSVGLFSPKSTKKCKNNMCFKKHIVSISYGCHCIPMISQK